MMKASGDVPDSGTPGTRRIVVVSNVPTPYRVPALRALANLPGVKLDVIYCAPPHIDKTLDAAAHGFEPHFLTGRYFVFERRFLHDDFNVVRLLKTLKPDVVVTTGYIPTFLYAFGWAWLTGAKHVVMSDGTLKSEQPLSRLHRVVRRFVFRRSAAFIGACEGSLDLFRSYGVPAGRMFMAPLAIANERYMRDEREARPVDLLFCGRMVEHKRPEFALEVAAAVARRVGRKVSIDFLGAGVKLDEVKARAESMSDLVVARFHGHVKQSELPALYGAAKIFLFPSEWDPWGVVGNEAAATGMPIVVSPFAGVAGELVQDGRNGYIVPLDENRWVEAVVTLLEDKALRERMGRCSRELVGSFTFEAAAQGMLAAFKCAVPESNRTGTRAPFIIASLMRPEGTTGVQTHMNAFADHMARKGAPVVFATPFQAPAILRIPLLVLRRVVEKVSPPAGVWVYRVGHAWLVRIVLRRLLKNSVNWHVYAQCPVSADAALRVRYSSETTVSLVVHFNISQADEWAEKGRIAHRGPMYFAIRGFERRVLARVDALIFVSRFMRDQIAALIPESLSVRQEVIPNFVVRPKADEGQLMADLISIGTLEPRKNQGYLLEILAAAKAAGRVITLTLVGDGPDRQSLESQAARLGISGQVNFAGFLRRAADLIARHRAYVHVAKMESFGIVLIEAMAAGRPVLATIAGGMGEVFDDGIEGRYLPADNAVAAAEIVVATLADEGAMARMAAAARERHAQHYDTEFVASKLEQFIVDGKSLSTESIAAKSVLIVQRRMLHYRVPLFDRLREELARSGIELRVAYSIPSAGPFALNSDEGSLEWGEEVYKREFFGGRIVWQDIRHALRGVGMVVLMQENRMLFNYLVPLLYPKVKWSFFGHGRNFQADSDESLKERFKLWYLLHPDWWFAYTARSARVVTGRGYPVERLTVLNNTIDDAELRADLAAVTDDMVATQRRDWGLGNGPVALMLGTLYAPKRIEFMLEAVLLIRERVPGFQLLMVGDGPFREIVRDAVSGSAGGIVWVGSQVGRNKAVALRCARILTNPGMVGLGIIDSFISGVPMVTCDIPTHSPEIEYLQSGVNGLITRSSVQSFVDGVVGLLADETRLLAMAEACRRDAAVYTLQAMVGNFAGGIRNCLAQSEVEVAHG